MATRLRTRRLFSSAAAAALAITGVVIAAPSAEAKVVPRTYDASFVAPASATHGVASPYSLRVTNTSTSISALDRIRITIPDGFSVAPGSVSAAGWTESLSGTTLTAQTRTPLRTGLRRGASLTVSFVATAPLGCDAMSVAWPLRVDGVLLVFSGPTPSVDVAKTPEPCASDPGGADAIDLSIPGAGGASLPNGSNGPVSLVVQQCSGPDPRYCGNGTEIELLGDFKNLYSNDAPATLIRVCSGSSSTACAHRNGRGALEPNEGDVDYDYNHLCAGNCAEYGRSAFDEREVEEDFFNFPTYISIKKDGVVKDFTEAGRCVPLPAANTSAARNVIPDPAGGPNLDALLVTGRIIDEAAKTAGFCIDVNAITRVGNEFGGDLIIPILFVEDIKARP